MRENQLYSLSFSMRPVLPPKATSKYSPTGGRRGGKGEGDRRYGPPHRHIEFHFAFVLLVKYATLNSYIISCLEYIYNNYIRIVLREKIVRVD